MGAIILLSVGLALPGGAPGAVAAALVCFALAASLAMRGLPRGYAHDRIGLCNLVTLARLVLVGVLLSLLLAAPGPSWTFCMLAALALGLDGLDGWLARREALVSTFGARFDMEVDSALALVLAVNAALGTAAGPAALVLGLPRYLFAAASMVVPWMRGALPDRFSRKAVCVLQLATLIALQAPALPAVAGAVLGTVAAAALVWSFATDIVWLRRNRA